MRILLISNTFFGLKKSSSFLKYFNNYLIPYIEDNFTSNDILLHMGGLFNQKNINISTMNKIYILFNKLSSLINIKYIVSEKDIQSKNIKNNCYLFLRTLKNIEIIEEYKEFDSFKVIPYTTDINKYKSTDKITFYNNKNYMIDGINGYYPDFNSNNIGSPYQIDENDEGKFRGIAIYDLNKNSLEFVENNYNKKYLTYVINKEEDIDKLSTNHFKNNIIHVKINSNLYSNYENKINVFLSQNDINKVSYFNTEENNNQIDEENNSSEIDNLITNEINKRNDKDALLKIFNNIKNIYNKKYN